MKRFKQILDWFPLGLLSLVVLGDVLWFTLSPSPTPDFDLPLFPGADKVGHAIMFGTLCFAVLLDFLKGRKYKLLSLPLISIIALSTALLGVGIEFAQEAMGMGRTLEIYDMLADAAGAVGFAALFAAIQGIIAKI